MTYLNHHVRVISVTVFLEAHAMVEDLALRFPSRGEEAISRKFPNILAGPPLLYSSPNLERYVKFVSIPWSPVIVRILSDRFAHKSSECERDCRWINRTGHSNREIERNMRAGSHFKLKECFCLVY